ncbi:hypothetical protein H5410_027216 [Solanum commersonii]|uniref:Uncharacterized protein n=1 Tax=Solanum commersonii TaxID=4109 RepID=A0A9J5Z2S5_SOLCO|nr:hypothetical protein H5410_027216 [Solanum commersonii]
MSTHSLDHQSSGLGFATSLSGKPKIHEWLCICNYEPFRLNHNHKTSKKSAGGCFGEVSRCYRMTSATRPSSVSSPFRTCLQHLHILDHWVGFAYWNKGQSKTLRSTIQKGCLKQCYKDPIMNIHNKIQITYAQINCVLNDSSCDTPFPEILVLAILATCASSSSTKNQESEATLTLKKRNTMHIKNVFLRLVLGMSGKKKR